MIFLGFLFLLDFFGFWYFRFTAFLIFFGSFSSLIGLWMCPLSFNAFSYGALCVSKMSSVLDKVDSLCSIIDGMCLMTCFGWLYFVVILKWQVGFENVMKITPIFTITYSSKMLIRLRFTSLEHTFLVNVKNSPKLI